MSKKMMSSDEAQAKADALDTLTLSCSACTNPAVLTACMKMQSAASLFRAYAHSQKHPPDQNFRKSEQEELPF